MSKPVSQPTSPRSTRFRGPLARHVALALALLVTVGVYARSVGYPFVNWDDPLHVYRNPAIIAPQTMGPVDRWLPRSLGYPMPLTMASYRMDRALWVSGSRPTLLEGRGFHLTNLLLALLLVALVYALATRVLAERLAAGLATLLFAAHPLLTEPICWISARKDLLMAVFVLAALLAWLALLDSGRRRSALLFVLFAFCALASKPTAVALVPLTFYLAWGERARWPAGHSRWPALVVLALTAAAALALTVVSWQWNHAVGGVQAPPAPDVLLRRVLWGLGFHLSLVIAPLSLTPKYIVTPASLSVFDALGLAAIVGLAFVLWRHRRQPRHPAALGAALFISAYLPVSSLIPLTRFIADSYLLLPLCGLALMIGAGLKHLRWHATPYFYRVMLGLTLLFMAASSLISWRQASIWSSAPSLWTHQRAHYAGPQVCRMLGQAYNEVGAHQRALRTYRSCAARYGTGLVENNLALTYYFLGRFEQAERHFRRILARKPTDRRALKYLRLLERRSRPRR